MIEYIKKIRSKPEEHKKKILYVLMIVSMSFVVCVWFLSLGFRLGNNSKKENVVPEKKEEVKPFSLLKSLFSDSYKNLKPKIKIDTDKNIQKETENKLEEVESDKINVTQTIN